VTLVSSIITDAYRESNILAIAKDPNAAQVTEALRLYNALIESIYGGDAGEQLNDWPLGNFGRTDTDCALPLDTRRLQHPTINRRLIALNETAMTVYFVLRPQDGARMGIADPFGRLEDFPVTVDARDRPVEGAQTLVLDVNGTFREWFYRSDLAAWMKLNALEATDENPFPAKFDNMFIIMLAMRLNPRYGRALDQQSAEIVKQGRQQFVARYLQSQPLEVDDSISWPFMSRQGYDQQRSFSSNEAFTSGYYPGPWAGG
jgi:hypothetical protein